MNLEELIKEIIPPADYHHREGFNNEPIIDRLTATEKQLVEDALIGTLASSTSSSPDSLVIETLSYLKSEKALPVLYEFLKVSSDDFMQLILSSNIYQINKDETLIPVAIKSFNKIGQRTDAYYVYSIIGAFCYLRKFHHKETNKLIAEYVSHKEYLISYNAKRWLEIG